MSTMSSRIRKARIACGISQTELARRLGIKRSAVTQWESPHGTVPNVDHLIKIAVEAGINFEWLATGRGPSRCGPESETALLIDDYAMDSDESAALVHLRQLSSSKKKIALRILEALSH